MNEVPRRSRRLDWDAATNELAKVVEAGRSSGHPILDLTGSNPIRAGFPPCEEISKALATVDLSRLEPSPLGLPVARKAVAGYLQEGSVEEDPSRVVITASTSEAYGLLFQVLGDPGDNVVSHAPSYPLLDHLCALEGLELRRCKSFTRDRRWQTPVDELVELVDERTAAVVIVSPNNPTGATIRSDGIQRMTAALIACRKPVTIIVDQVFADYPLEAEDERTHFHSSELPVVLLGGLSKTAALPQLKLAWMRLDGSGKTVEPIIRALEIAADARLSVADPIQMAVGSILDSSGGVRSAIRERCRRNLRKLRETFPLGGAVEIPIVDGGWSAVLRAPVESGRDRALDLANRGVFVHPGWLYDFPVGEWLVVSLLTPPVDFDEGMELIRDSIAL